MARFLILTPDAQYADDGVIETAAGGDQCRFEIYRQRDFERIPAESLAACDALLVWHEVKVTGALLPRIPRCRIVVRAGVGFDHIDLAAMGAAGIPVCNTPDYGTSEVADHALALALAFTRGIVSYHEALTADPVSGYDVGAAPLVRRMRGTNFGVVGLGRIGTAAVLRARGFGFRLLAFDPYLPRGQEIALGVERVENLEALLAAADIVSIHCPLTAETRGMFGAAAFAAMRPHAILINTARGGIVDPDALLAALRDGRIAAAGIDVLPVEPPDPASPLVAAYAAQPDWLRGRLIINPHAAWSSPESRHDARRLSAETAVGYLVDGRLRNLVNGEFLKRPLR